MTSRIPSTGHAGYAGYPSSGELEMSRRFADAELTDQQKFWHLNHRVRPEGFLPGRLALAAHQTPTITTAGVTSGSALPRPEGSFWLILHLLRAVRQSKVDSVRHVRTTLAPTATKEPAFRAKFAIQKHFWLTTSRSYVRRLALHEISPSRVPGESGLGDGPFSVRVDPTAIRAGTSYPSFAP